MSATVDSENFSSYFQHCPIVNIPGRTFPVEVGDCKPISMPLFCVLNHRNTFSFACEEWIFLSDNLILNHWLG